MGVAMSQQQRRWQNMGAPFPRDDGRTMVARGEVCTVTPRELRLWGYKLQPVTGDAGVDPEAGEAAADTAGAEGATSAWPLKMAPALYVALHPEGQHAARARELMAAADVAAAGEGG
jgi:hypothetical protein